jgi:hypothetical protein
VIAIEQFRKWSVILVVVGLSVFSTISARELWPFSHYPMFSGPTGYQRPTAYALQGVSIKNGQEVEFPLAQKGSLRPYNSFSANQFLAMEYQENGMSGLTLALKEFGGLYDQRKTKSMPDFTEIRLYEEGRVVGVYRK